ncbi:aldo/keto reductase [Microbacterium enclense]|uniref:Aldo/keto reductase n=1 Tax=Microbacterium enclense TaxID=993073 RepID=A0A443JCJ4_9MICO|nr:aldo/keto reductase [Microbacterium enclense]RWR18222.1 aldo/keto reductase [Microbacterium enclense]
MRTRSTPKTPALTEIGFGGAQIGNLGREVDDDTARLTVDTAWDAGIRYFDTAPHYGLGLSERRLGAALRDRPREEYVLSTKVGRLLVDSPETAHRLDDDGFAVPAAVVRRWDFSRDGVMRSVEESLDRLGVDRIDIAYLHDPDAHWDAASTTGVGALIELREQGVVRAVGAGMNQASMLADFVERCDVDIVMVAGRYTLLDDAAAERLLPLAAERGVGVVAAAVYNSGLLSHPRPAPDATYDYTRASSDLLERAHRIADICERYGVDLPSAAIAYPLRRDEVVSVVVGIRTAAQAESTVERYRARVPEEMWRELTATGVVAQ